MDLSTLKIETSEKLEIVFVLHLLITQISDKTTQNARQEEINRSILLSADLTVNLQLVPHLTNKNFYKAITTLHPMWSATIQPAIALTNYETFAR